MAQAKRQVRAGAVRPSEGEGLFSAVIEASKGTRHKFKFDPTTGYYKLSHVLPAGACFPLDFGFVPGTAADDGDPLDVLVLVEEAVPVGCLVVIRLIGVVQAEQTENGKNGRTYRNDRLLSVAEESRQYRDVQTLEDLPGRLLDEIEEFFVSYNTMRGRTFRVIGRAGPETARATVDKGVVKKRA